MMNINVANVIEVLKLKVQERFNIVSSNPSQLEIDLADKLINIVLEVVNNCEINEETILSLETTEHSDIDVEELENLSQQSSQQSSQQQSQGTIASNYSTSESLIINNEEFSIQFIEKVVNYHRKFPDHKFKTINHQFPRVKYQCPMLYQSIY